MTDPTPPPPPPDPHPAATLPFHWDGEKWVTNDGRYRWNGAGWEGIWGAPPEHVVAPPPAGDVVVGAAASVGSLVERALEAKARLQDEIHDVRVALVDPSSRGIERPRFTPELAVADATSRFMRRTGLTVLDDNTARIRAYTSKKGFLKEGRALAAQGWYQEVDPDETRRFRIGADGFQVVIWRHAP